MIYLMMIDEPEQKRKFVIIYEKYRYLMLKIADDVLQDKFLAEDVVHESFIKIAKNMRNIGDVNSISTKRYLITITKNTAIDLYRIRKKHIQEEFSVDEMEGITGQVVYMESDIENVVLDAIKNLPVTYRDVFLLKYSVGMSYAEIAEGSQLPEGTIRQRVARGKKILQQVLDCM